MFFLGHMVWAYTLARPFAKSVNMPLVMLLGVLPDIDILFNSFIEHRSITHSIPIISILSIPFFVKYRKQALPYYIALTQHIFFGDLIVSKTQLFWPFGPRIGLDFRLVSIENIIIEGIGLGIFILLLIKDRKLLVLMKNNILLSIPLVILIIFPITYGMYELDNESIDNFRYVLREDNAFIALLLHITLAIILTIILIQGVRAYTLRQSDFSKFREK